MTEMTFQGIWCVGDVSLGTTSLQVEFPGIIKALLLIWLAKFKPNLILLCFQVCKIVDLVCFSNLGNF